MRARKAVGRVKALGRVLLLTVSEVNRLSERQAQRIMDDGFLRQVLRVMLADLSSEVQARGVVSCE